MLKMEMAVCGAAGNSLVVPGGVAGQGWLGDTWMAATEVVIGWEKHWATKKEACEHSMCIGLEIGG